VNAYYSAYLFGLATANPDLTHFAHVLLTAEVQATQLYWHMPNTDIYDTVFAANRMVGNVGALDVTASTWFGNQLEYVHGINIMPLTPATALLLDSQYVATQWPVLGNRLPPVTSTTTQQCSANPRKTLYFFRIRLPLLVYFIRLHPLMNLLFGLDACMYV
jgi:endoglucanase Acf2